MIASAVAYVVGNPVVTTGWPSACRSAGSSSFAPEPEPGPGLAHLLNSASFVRSVGVS